MKKPLLKEMNQDDAVKDESIIQAFLVIPEQGPS